MADRPVVTRPYVRVVDRKSRRLAKLPEVYLIEPASLGYRVVRRVEGLDGADLRKWHLTFGGALTDLRAKVGEAILDGYEPHTVNDWTRPDG